MCRYEMGCRVNIMTEISGDPHSSRAATTRGTVAITGASGLVGTALGHSLQDAGASVMPLVRRTPRNDHEGQWDPASGLVDPTQLRDVEAVVHLAGEGIADGRWTDAKMRRIRDSRVQGTTALAQSLARMESRPRVLVCASAIGYYGNRGDAELDEWSEPGQGFLPEVCQEWEAATAPALDAGIRVVNVRIGIVLSPRGGALAKMLLPFKMGVGGVVGSGKQYWSWIGLADLVGVFRYAIDADDLHGPVNATAPQPLTNREFTRVLGQALHRPTIFPMPAMMAKLALGQMAEDLLLSSARVLPKKLEASGFQFEFPDLKSCLEHELAQA